MGKYVKKPVQIEAIQWTGDNYDEISKFTESELKTITLTNKFTGKIEVATLEIETLEGTMSASVGDYIIKGIQGEFYPCKPDIFEATYTSGGVGSTSDGYHTFDELYHHRMILFATICNLTDPKKTWKSWKHHDGTMYDDYFIVGVETDKGQYSYHYHKDNWNYFETKEVEFAPEWDGHTPSDIDRLLTLK